MKNQPVKRSEHIVQLSHDHHIGLLFSWKIREGLKRQVAPERLLNYVNFFWQHNLTGHFNDEETLLFNKLGDPLSERAKKEHLQLKAGWEKLNSVSRDEAAAYGKFAEDLVQHIRFEEREVFPYLEAHLFPEILLVVASALKQRHTASVCDNYPDEFWKDRGQNG